MIAIVAPLAAAIALLAIQLPLCPGIALFRTNLKDRWGISSPAFQTVMTSFAVENLAKAGTQCLCPAKTWSRWIPAFAGTTISRFG
ncbi:MAG: hypothetical protein ACREO0_01830 [Pseudoxanthomonas sp.]